MVEGAISLGDVRVYELFGNVRNLTLTSLSGDADLYVVSGTSFDRRDISCESREPTPVDYCAVGVSPDRQFALVFGYSNSRFNLDTRAPAEDPGLVEPTSLQASSSGGAIGCLIIAGLLLRLMMLACLRRRV